MTNEEKVKKLNYVLASFLMFLKLLDVISTIIGLNIGYIEGNPVAKFLIGISPYFVFITLIHGIIFYVINYFLKDSLLLVVLCSAMVFLSVGQFFVVYNNFVLIF